LRNTLFCFVFVFVFVLLKNIELKKLSSETQNLKDEIDILKHNRDKVNKLESTIETYKIKLEEMSDFKNQMRLLEETNTQYMQTIIKMEEETKKIQALKNQIEMYKKQIQDLHENIRIQEMKVKKYELENKKLEERFLQEQNEKEQLVHEIDKLKETNEHLQSNLNTSTIEMSHNTSNTSLSNGSFSELELINVPFELKEKIFRLYHENKILKTKQNEFDEEKLLILQNQYDDERARTNDLQIRLNEAQLQIINCEAQISDLKYSLNNKSPKNVPNNDEENRKLQQKIDHLTIEKNIMREQLNNKEKEIFELNDLNEKYRNYLEKAKIVIKSLDPVNNPTNNNELQNLKNQLSDKDKYIKQLLVSTYCI
jgi:chromosome segregation ATPase